MRVCARAGRIENPRRKGRSRLLARFDGSNGLGQWRIAEAVYRIALGRSAGDLLLAAEAPLTGTAIADAIFGITNPGGKLPMTLPRHSGQIPIQHGQKRGSGVPSDQSRRPPRLSRYALHAVVRLRPRSQLQTFEYSPLKLASDSIDVSGEARVTLTIRNTGNRRGTEVVQLHAADTATGVTLSAQQLIGFARVDLQPGASKNVQFVVPISLLAYTGIFGDLLMKPGLVEVSVGSCSSDIRSKAMFTITGTTRTIRGEDRAFLSVTTVAS